MGIRTYGPNAVDWEERVDVDRLRTQRLERLKEALDRSELGALLSFDFHNIRYMTSTHIGTCLLYTSPSPRDYAASRMPSSA